MRYRTIFSFQTSLWLQCLSNPYMTPTYLSKLARLKIGGIELKQPMLENLPDSKLYRRVFSCSPLRWAPDYIVISGQSTELQVIHRLNNRLIHASFLDDVDVGVTKRRCCPNKIAKSPIKIEVRFKDRQRG